LKTIHGESFDVQLEEKTATVLFKGAIRLCGTEDYAPILDMLQETLINPTTPIVLDLRELEFLNSSGITMLSRFVIQARDRTGIDLQVLASEAVPWHARSLKNLQRLMPSLSVRLT
jgi:hypothetical protein